ncbi:MAG: carbamate kinase [Pirellulales bacterium]
MKRCVVVLGGNAFTSPGQRLTMQGQLRFAHEALGNLAPLLEHSTQLLISHGNGPQVGHMLTRVEAAIGKAYPLPLEVCVAESEGELGYVLQQALYNLLSDRHDARASAVLLSQVEVDPADPAFANPTKPIGMFYDAAQAAELERHGYVMAEDAGRGWRRVVPSPEPRRVLELDVIRRLLDEQIIVIAAGGGGIPIVQREGRWEGVEAVVDKDLTGALLAVELNADEFIILTDVPCVYRNFRAPDRQPLARLTTVQARALADAGQFAAGSMGPKVEAAIRFVERTGRTALICNPGNLAEALAGRAGTRISAAVTAQPRATRERCVILGAAGRDFHNFRTFFRDHSTLEVVAFTAAQIPFIDERRFPAELAGPNYPHGIPIYSESRLAEVIREHQVSWAFLSYSDLSHEEVMHKASLVQAAGASFALLGPQHTQIASQLPVVAVTACRTGVGKSPVAQHLAHELTNGGRRVGVLRHPMPYGDLARQRVERLATRADLDRYECTVEEREEYEPYIDRGLTIFAGVDYVDVLAAAEAESDVILWDGGNNDFSFLRPDASIVLVDALRPGHESRFYPGETNVRAADLLIINKADGADAPTLAELRRSLAELNPRAPVIEARLAIDVDHPERITGRRVLVVEDGPTLTHGGMTYGAGVLAARRWQAAELVDPRATAVGGIALLWRDFPALGAVLPALGYSEVQRRELAQTISASGAETVIDASPCRLERLIEIAQPVVRVSYRFEQLSGPPLAEWVRDRLAALAHRRT